MNDLQQSLVWESGFQNEFWGTPLYISSFEPRRNGILQGQVIEVIYLNEQAFRKTELGLQ